MGGEGQLAEHADGDGAGAGKQEERRGGVAGEGAGDGGSGCGGGDLRTGSEGEDLGACSGRCVAPRGTPARHSGQSEERADRDG